MQKKSEMQLGWEFAANIAMADIAAHAGASYVDAVEKAIIELENSINNHAYRGQDIAHFQGYVQEAWHAGTLNVNAVASGSQDFARTLDSHEKWSVDITLDSGRQVSAKSIATGAKSGIAQAAYNPETGSAGYAGLDRLVPTDQLSEAKAEVLRRSMKNAETRPDVSAAYCETHGKLVDRITNSDGVESNTASRKELEQMAAAGKRQEFSAEEAGVSLKTSIPVDYVMEHAIKAGYTSAAITIAMQLAPEIYKAIDYLIKNGELNVAQLKALGPKAISAGAEGFLRGSVSYSLLIMCEQGLLGEGLKGISPSLLGSVVAIVMQTVKNSIMVASGKMSPSQMGSAFVDSVVISGGYLLGAQIGGMIGQALGFELPVIGYLLGSLVGTSFAVIYNIGKKTLISFCVETGFTCFGLVEQNFELPEDVLADMGVHTIPIPRTVIDRVDVDRISTVDSVNRVEYETIDISVLRRGIIGVNKIGYVPV